jgi:hypothetical protein
MIQNREVIVSILVLEDAIRLWAIPEKGETSLLELAATAIPQH